MFKKVLLYISQIIKLVIYLIKMEDYYFNKFPYLNKYKGKKARIMGNGPSLKNVLNDYKNGKREIESDTFFVNFAPLDSTFYQIKPKHLCISDFVFARDTEGKTEMVRKLYNLLESKVDWNLNIYLGFSKRKDCLKLIEFSKITNPKIHFVFLNRKYCSGLIPQIRHKLYQKGLFMPEEGSIINTAIYIALIEGYSEIELYGVEHNMFLDIRVNECNKLCILQKNFYDNQSVLVPVCNDSDSSSAKIHDYMNFIYVMFHSHYLLQQFAEFLGSHIYNCTSNSMIDVYERRN